MAAKAMEPCSMRRAKGSTRGRNAIALLHHSLPDPAPEFFASGRGLDRVGQQVFDAVFFRQGGEGVAGLVAGHAVGLGGPPDTIALHAAQIVNQLTVALLDPNL